MPENLDINTGDLRWPITIQAPSTTQNSIGGLLTSWTPVLTCRAKIQNTQTATYRASTTDDTISNQTLYIMTIRWPGWNVQITPNMTILYNGQTYEINAINNVLQANRFLQIFCMVINGNG